MSFGEKYASSAIRQARFSPCGFYMSSAGDNGTVMVWKSNIAALKDISYRTDTLGLDARACKEPLKVSAKHVGCKDLTKSLKTEHVLTVT